MKKFKLEIEMENSATFSTDDVSDALRDVANKMLTWSRSRTDGSIFDTNGNRVGFWKIRNFKERKGG